MCLTDDNGAFRIARTTWLHASATVKEAEASGLLEALDCVASMSYSEVIFELGSKGIFDAVYESGMDSSKFSVVVDGC
ncbi:hypothetical protein PTKIN_Ptkin11bG0114700 [Pterospermum kingtungense]